MWKIIRQIYTADYSQKGYNDGIKAGKGNQPQAYWGAMRISPINYLWHYDDAHNSYSKSYKTGYVDGQRVDHNIYSQGGGMTDLEQQKHHLQEVQSGIQHHIRLLEQARETYGTQVHAMSGVGFANDYTAPLNEQYRQLHHNVDEMIDELRRQIELIGQFIASLDELIREARTNTTY